MIANLVRAVPAALAGGVLPGYFWACFVRRADGLAERLAYSAALSLAGVPAVAVLLTRVLGTGVTLPLAIASVVIVAGSGALACRIWGTAGHSQRAATGASDPSRPAPSRLALPWAAPSQPALPRPAAIQDGRALALIILAVVLAVIAALARQPAPGWLLALVAATVAGAGLLAGWRGGITVQPGSGSVDQAVSGSTGPGGTEAQGGAGFRPLLPRAARGPVLAVVLALTTLRAYLGVVWHDWPWVRGEDMFSHAVMTEQMLAHGSYSAYLVYPPGFATTSAVICRFAGLPPLALFPVIAPALMVLTTLAAYALATRLWGWDYGVIAAAVSGLVLIGPDVSLGGGLYPDLLAAFFFMVMVVAALISLYQSPSVRSGLLVAVTGAAVVLYHSVGCLYLVLLLAAVVAIGLPYLLLRGGREGRAVARALVLSLAALGVLAVACAWHIYGLGDLEGRSGGTSATVSLDMGSQPVLRPGELLSWVGSPVLWLGLLGFVLLALSLRRLARPGPVLCALTLLLWCAAMYAGSRTAVDGFPQRFERDVGAPLAMLATLGAGVLWQSLVRLAPGRLRVPRPGLAALAAGAAVVVAVAAGAQAASNLAADSKPSREVVPPAVAAAGTWLHQHNTGGTIISTPDMNRGVTNRAVLAMGYYTGLQSYPLPRIIHPRSLPTAGRGPLLDSREVLTHPTACRVGGILAAQDVRYVFLYRLGNEADFAGFRADPGRYRQVFENPAVIIYAPASHVLATDTAC